MCLDSLKFLALGDWGGIPTYPYYLPPEKAVGEQMGAIANDFQTQFVLALGDNFYFEGVKDVEDIRFFVSHKFFFSISYLVYLLYSPKLCIIYYKFVKVNVNTIA